MKAIVTIGHHDLRVFLRNRAAIIWLFLVPLAFVYFMGFASPAPGDPVNRRPRVAVENADPGFLSRLFLEELGAQGMQVLPPTNQAHAERGVRLPPDFTRRLVAHEPARVGFFQVANSDAGDAALVELRVVRALVAMNAHLLEVIALAGDEGVADEAAWRQVMARPDPVRLEARFAGHRPVPSGFAFSLPGNLVMYLMMNLLVFGGAALAAERRSGVLRRISLHPVTRYELVFGKIYGLVLLGAVQIAALLTAGRLLFGVNPGASLPAVVITLLVFAWVAASLGVLAGSLVRNEDRVVGLCVLASLVMAALGGCWWPLEIAPAWLRTLAHCLPTGWALDALHQLISFGAGWEAVLRPLAVLAGFGIAANLLAARCFRV
jgi:ABC-type multidrug transport system permease subunit